MTISCKPSLNCFGDVGGGAASRGKTADWHDVP